MGGNEFFRLCTGTEEEKFGCLFFVMGAVDVMDSLPSTAGCRPPGVIVQQTVDIVTKYLRDHPERRQDSAVALIWEAQNAAFPCPK